MRAVIDANVWISGLLNPQGAPAAVLQAYRDGKFTLVASDQSFDELRDVLSRPRFGRYGITPEIVAEYVELLREGAHLAQLAGELEVCRDPKDNYVIELAIVGQAQVVVSRDEDLTRAPEVVSFLEDKGVRVLTVQHFLEQLRGT